MDYCNVFKRYEIKYLLSIEQYRAITNAMQGDTERDEYGKSTVCSLYFDTPDFRMIRKSLEKPVYKEKLRVRSYGQATEDGKVFVELKKKYKSVTYKRRVALTNSNAKEWLAGGAAPEGQIAREIGYTLNFYKNLVPAVLITYERDAFRGDNELRITFDHNILWRGYDLSLTQGIYGNAILPKGFILMEVKTPLALPLWLTDALTKNHICHTSFSKYGQAYAAINGQKDLFHTPLYTGGKLITKTTGELIYV